MVLVGRVPGNFPGSWKAWGEFRRLTMRGLALPRLLVHRSLAAWRSTSSNQRLRRRGPTGRKCPGVGLGTAQQVNMARKRKSPLLQTLSACRLVHQPAHSVMRQHPAVKLLAHTHRPFGVHESADE